MISCPNKSSKEWKTLSAEIGEDRAMLAYIRNGNNIPDVSKGRELITNKGLLESISSLPLLTKEGIMQTLETNNLIVGNPITEDGREYYQLNPEINNIAEQLGEYTTMYGTVLEYKGDYVTVDENSLDSWNKIATLQRMQGKSLTDLSKEFLTRAGIALAVQDDVIKRYGSNGIADFAEKMIRIQSGMEDEALPEEALHFFLDMIPQDNPALIEALDKIRNTQTYKDTYQKYKDNPNYKTKDGKVRFDKMRKEALAKELASQMKAKEKKGWLAALIEAIMNWIKGIKVQKNPMEILQDMFFSEDIAMLNTNLSSSEVYNQLTDKEKAFYEAQATTPQQKESLNKILAYSMLTGFDPETHIYTSAKNVSGDPIISTTKAIGSDFYSELENPDVIAEIVTLFVPIIGKEAKIESTDSKEKQSQKVLDFITTRIIDGTTDPETMFTGIQGGERLKELMYKAAESKTKTLFGTAIHAIAEAVILGKKVNLEPKSADNPDGVDPIIYKLMDKTTLNELIYGTARKPGIITSIQKMVSRGSVIMAEIPMSNGILAGVLDIIEIKTDGVAEIHDFKTKFLKNFGDKPSIKEGLLDEFKSAANTKSQTGVKDEPTTIRQLKNIARTRAETWSQQLSIYKKFIMEAGVPVGAINIIGIPYRLDPITRKMTDVAVQEVNNIPYDESLASYLFDDIDPNLNASFKKAETLKEDVRIKVIKQISNDSLKDSFAKSLAKLMQLLNKVNKGDKMDELYKLLNDAETKTNRLKDQVSNVKQTLENFDLVKDKNILEIQKNFLEMIDSSAPIIETAIKRFDELKKTTPTNSQGESQKLNELMKINDFLNGYRDMFEELVDYLKDADDKDNIVKGRLNEVVGLITGIHNDYVDIITPSIIKLLGESFNEDLLNNMKREYNELISAAKLRGDKKREEALTKERDNLPSYEVIKEILKGNKGDVGPIMSKIVATISNPDIVIAGAAKRLKTTLDRVRLSSKEIRDEMGKELQKRFNVYGRGLDIKQNNQSLTYVVEETNPYTGEKMEVLHFLSEFDEKLYSELNKLEFAVVEAEKTKDIENIKAAKKAVREFEKKYLQTGYTPEYYKLTKALDITVKYQGKDITLREIESDINKQIRNIELEYTADDINSGIFDPQHFKELQRLHEQKAELREKLDAMGNPKTGEPLRIALALEEYDKNKKLLFEYTDDMVKFNRSKEKAKLEYGEGSELFEKWMANNTRIAISEEYYKELTDINVEMEELSGQGKSEEIKNLYNELNKISAPYRDKDGYINGKMISAETSKKIKDIQRKIEEIQLNSTFDPFNMFTKEESDRMKVLRYLRDSKLPGFDQIEYNKIIAKAEQRQNIMLSKNKNLNDQFEAKKKRYAELRTMLFAMKKQENSKYYIEEREKRERDFAEARNMTYKEFLLNEAAYNEFKESEWFVSNHIIKSKVLYEDATTGEVREARTEIPTHQWRRNMPVEKYIIEKPARQYTKTILKDSYTDENGKEIKLRQTDNLDIRERMKPKTNEEYSKEFGVDHPFLNKTYSDLKTKNKSGTPSAREKVDYENLLYIEKKMLKSQEGIEVSQRLGLAVPFMEKKTFERTISSGGKNISEKAQNIAEGLKRMVTRTDQDIDQEGITSSDNDIRNDVSKLATVDNDQVRFVPVRFSRKGDVANASYDVWGGMLNYLGSITRKKELESELAFINGLEQVLGEKANQPKSEDNNMILNNIYKKYIPDLKAKINLGSNTRLEVLKSFVNSVMYNQEYFQGYDILGVNTQKIVSQVMSLTSYTALGASPFNWATNWISGNIQNFVEGAGGKTYNISDFAAAHADVYAGGKYGSAIADMKSDYVSAKVGNLSFWGQVMEIFDPIQGEFENEYGKKTSFNHFKNIFQGGVFAGKIWGEWEIQMKSFIAFIKNHKLYNGEVMDKETFITKKIGTDFDTLSPKEISNLKLKAIEEWDKIDVNVLDMLELNKEGIMVVKDQYKDNFQLGSQTFSDIVAKLHAMQKKLNGSYAKFDKAYAEKTSLGRMVWFFRKYFIPLGMNRWGTRRPDFESMGVEQGFYLTFLQTVGKDITKFRFNVIKNWDTYSDQEKRAIKKTLADIGIILAIIATYTLVFGYDPDDPDRLKKLKEQGWAAQASVFLLLKVKSETEQFLPPLPLIGGGGLDEIKRVYSNPSLLFNQATQYINIAKYMGGHALSVFPGYNSSHLYYKADAGGGGLKDKGDSKLIAALMKTFVGYTGKTFNPLDAIKSYEYMSRQ